MGEFFRAAANVRRLRSFAAVASLFLLMPHNSLHLTHSISARPHTTKHSPLRPIIITASPSLPQPSSSSSSSCRPPGWARLAGPPAPPPWAGRAGGGARPLPRLRAPRRARCPALACPPPPPGRRHRCRRRRRRRGEQRRCPAPASTHLSPLLPPHPHHPLFPEALPPAPAPARPSSGPPPHAAGSPRPGPVPRGGARGRRRRRRRRPAATRGRWWWRSQGGRRRGRRPGRRPRRGCPGGVGPVCVCGGVLRGVCAPRLPPFPPAAGREEESG